MIFYLSIAIFIGSIIAALALMILGKRMPLRSFILMAAVHVALLILFFLSRSNQTAAEGTERPDFFFLLFICSGTALSGLAWRISAPLPMRIYFSIFMLTFPMFLFSPSRLVNFLLTTRYTDTLGKTFCVKENYFLEQQNSWSKNSAQLYYKLIVKRGIFHQTIGRDLDFGFSLDSIRTITFLKDSVAVVRGYKIKETYVSTGLDSTDIFIPLKSSKPGQIERKLIP